MVDGNIAAINSVKITEVFENMLTIATGAKESASWYATFPAKNWQNKTQIISFVVFYYHMCLHSIVLKAVQSENLKQQNDNKITV